ncbi:hypothetical protein BDBG_09105 [Blastomyces gilchristii SLH14081]|uniref:Aminoglycoside phosphotransferase domain-containing protein n=1 Tax=Blastomyces gilchristii (strain SLH14081) TaxID=559298 RepID=A0A179V1V7_BLAGS|nr:uncharacterized protein BDBG_09105 [Blastomyces gilchristii SLH14081]OAT14013.1 hypothetical protein BDBG_09105 [Blastomyces gilchristii SLH14081]
MSHLMDTILALGTRTTVQGGSGTTAQPSRYNFTWDHPVNSHCVPSGGRSPTPRPKEAMAMLYVSCLTRPSRRKFYTRIYRNRDAISKLVAHHLSIYPSACQVEVEEPKKWMSGSFNLCVPVNVNTFTTRNHAFSSSLSRWRELFFLATRMRSQECPSVPIPHLYGFGLSTGQLFTEREHLPFLTRLWYFLKCTIRKLLRLPLPSRLVQHPTTISNKLGPYLLLDFIEEADGRMLSDDWRDKHDDDQTLRMNLFRNLAKIILTLSHRPLPKIGSFTIDNDGFLRLENRPLAAAKSTIVENEETPLDIPRDRVYPTVDSDVNGILSVHDSYLRYQPNSLACVADCVTQMSALSMMRALSARFLEPGLNHGPFYLSLTDLHASNILIDDDWNIKYLIDLEWAICATIGIHAAALLANWRDWG